MSRTDKTRPMWVQIADDNNRDWRREKHDHRKGVCDLNPNHKLVQAYDWWHSGRSTAAPYNRWNTCIYDYSHTAYYGGIYPRRSKLAGWGRPSREGRARMHWRMLARTYMATARQDWDSVDSVWLRPSDALLWHKWRD